MKILYGISGLGNGHTFRQLPIITHFAKTHKIVLFAHDQSLSFYTKYFEENPNVSIFPVAIPFYTGSSTGLDFYASSQAPINQTKIFEQNCLALDQASKILGKPDLVISDYESVCAQYAYATGAPLVTIDQQSKFLISSFPETLAGFTYADEVARLQMFFPKVSERIICSFFDVNSPGSHLNAHVYPPTIKDQVTKLIREPNPEVFLVYISQAREYPQSPVEITDVLSQFPNKKFHLFVADTALYQNHSKNITIHSQGSDNFSKILSTCSGIITTAGHSLLSEAMFLEIPVFAIPVSPYEQHLNAKIIADNNFGIQNTRIEKLSLEVFFNNLTSYQDAIKHDKKVLKRGSGQDEIIPHLEEVYLNS